MKTYSLKTSNIKKQWIMIDANNIILGRLASIIAYRLRGKHKVDFSPHLDCGDNIIIINSKKIHLTGNKKNKKHYWHTGYPGGIKSRTTEELFNKDQGISIIKQAVKGMLPKGPLGNKQLKNLRIYTGQNNIINKKINKLDIINLNSKNSKTRKN